VSAFQVTSLRQGNLTPQEELLEISRLSEFPQLRKDLQKFHQLGRELRKFTGRCIEYIDTHKSQLEACISKAPTQSNNTTTEPVDAMEFFDEDPLRSRKRQKTSSKRNQGPRSQFIPQHALGSTFPPDRPSSLLNNQHPQQLPRAAGGFGLSQFSQNAFSSPGCLAQQHAPPRDAGSGEQLDDVQEDEFYSLSPMGSPNHDSWQEQQDESGKDDYEEETSPRRVTRSMANQEREDGSQRIAADRNQGQSKKQNLHSRDPLSGEEDDDDDEGSDDDDEDDDDYYGNSSQHQDSDEEGSEDPCIGDSGLKRRSKASFKCLLNESVAGQKHTNSMRFHHDPNRRKKPAQFAPTDVELGDCIADLLVNRNSVQTNFGRAEIASTAQENASHASTNFGRAEIASTAQENASHAATNFARANNASTAHSAFHASNGHTPLAPVNAFVQKSRTMFGFGGNWINGGNKTAQNEGATLAEQSPDLEDISLDRGDESDIGD